ncbi:MAG: SPOR domain-containing protein [Parasphingorhabdus sp.]|nr:SPOR domain-containing protein [Parasphingorhabdus sp.]
MELFSKNAHLFAVAALLVGSPAVADVRAGIAAWDAGDYKTAVAEWTGPADKGDADAKFNMGQAYKLGRGVPQDMRKAEEFYRQAAALGHVQASDNYGLILFQNNRRSEALPYLQASVARGEPRAQYVLGTGHFNGDFVAKDWVRAYALMTRSAASGQIPQAQQSLTQMDKYIPLPDRQRGVALAGQLEQEETRNFALMTNGLRPPPSTNGLQTAQIPPSNIPAPVAPPQIVKVPVPAPVPAPKPPAMPAPVALASAPAKTTMDGKWRIQLGAFGDQERAKALWSNLEGKVSALADLQPYLVTGGNVTRLQAGPFATQGQADAMCSKVKAVGQDCIAKLR